MRRTILAQIVACLLVSGACSIRPLDDQLTPKADLPPSQLDARSSQDSSVVGDMSPFDADADQNPIDLVMVDSTLDGFSPIVRFASVPEQTYLEPGEAMQLNAIAYRADGTSLDVTAKASWVLCDSTSVGCTPLCSNGICADSRGCCTITTSGYLTSLNQNCSCGGWVFFEGFYDQWYQAAGADTLISMSISPPTLTLLPGDEYQLEALGTWNHNGKPTTFDYAVADWNSSDSKTVAILSQAGQVNYYGTVSALQVGQARVTATSQGGSFTGTCVVTVADPSMIASIEVSPLAATIGIGESATLVAIAHWQSGGTTDVTNLASWTSTDMSVVTCNGSATITGASIGTATVTATYGGATGMASISVSQ